MNHAALLRRIEQLERSFPVPPSFVARVLRTVTDEQLEQIEADLARQGWSEVWDAASRNAKDCIG